jgi:hypothetical protein
MLLPTAKGSGRGLGVQTAVAPAGVEATLQVGAAAALGPLLVHVTVPLAVLPAIGLLGNPLTVATMSACGTTVVVALAVLLAGVGSAVAEAAVPVTVTLPLAGAV